MDKNKIKKLLDEGQTILSEAYKEEGLTPEILECQVKLNEIRNILNIPDDNEKIYEDYVQ